MGDVPDDHLPRALSAKFKEDFAYPTVKDRMPVILTKAIDTLHQQKAAIREEYGESGTEDLKGIVARMSKLRNELQTDKVLIEMTDMLPDVAVWNSYLQEEGEREGEAPRWFLSPWLYTECYFYRRISEAIQLSNQLKHLDPFQQQKENALVTSHKAILALGQYMDACSNHLSPEESKKIFSLLFKVCLWGNKCDLSISAGRENSQKFNPLSQLDNLASYLLTDDVNSVWEHLEKINSSSSNTPNTRVDIVLDNAGFELFTDLCLSEFLLDQKIAKEVHFHAKSIPWFVSDVTTRDWNYTLNKLVSSEEEVLNKLGRKWQQRLSDGSWKFNIHPFWTLPHDFSKMKVIAPDLYSQLRHSHLILFKGDLNYRKLVGDYKWDPVTSFKESLCGFHPAPVCALRTLKCDTVVGLRSGQAEAAAKTGEKWMLDGNFGVIQFCSDVL